MMKQLTQRKFSVNVAKGLPPVEYLRECFNYDSETGELRERRLAHREEAERFYRELQQQGLQVRVGMA